MSTDLHIFHKTISQEDYDAAAKFLNLLYTPERVAKLVEGLKKSPVQVNKAVDILRAAELELLPIENPNVQKNLFKARKNEKMAPVVLVRGEHKLIVADGYHRICTAYYLREDVEIPFIIA
ncbi:hypothetical protein [Kaistella palustris]|uniref:hypothetical protein n=1 Tax=Kaistella palustris TaxID=493376 RepID=UPI00040BCF86|nr:hypothetical protein [Kaistella palustris]